MSIFRATLILSMAMFSSLTFAADASSHHESKVPMSFVKIKAKTFLMGSAHSENGRNFDESIHFVTITKDFEIQATAITQAQWVQIMHINPSQFKAKEDCPEDYTEIKDVAICAHHPVESVSFADTQEFIKKLNSLHKKYQYRLPTEAEWELAARGGSGRSYFFSDDGTDFDKYVVSNADTTAPVASKLPNQFGLYDMLGNVSQWVHDYYDYYPQINPEETTIDPMGPAVGNYRIVRGGDWYDYMWNHFRSASRKFAELNESSPLIGFRLVRFENQGK